MSAFSATLTGEQCELPVGITLASRHDWEDVGHTANSKGSD